MPKRKSDVSETLMAAMHADLAASGLDSPRVIKALGLTKPLTPVESERLTTVRDCVVYEIPYHDLTGKRTSFSRWKLLPFGDEEPEMKYYQVPNSIPQLYLPPLIDWREVAEDSTRRLVITEGEKKAACACLHDLACVAVGGVWSHKSSKFGLELLRDFDLFEWRDRIVEICYDADLASNDDVRRAKNNLSASLRARGARVYTRLLPETDGASKLDDFLVKHGVERYWKLSIDEDGGSKELHALNEKIMYVVNTKSFYGIDEEIHYRNVDELGRKYGKVKILDEKGKSTRAVNTWVDWEGRREVDRLTYEPGQPAHVDGAFNVWRPHDLRPQRGSVSLFLEVLEQVENHKWLLQWLAYPLVHPGAKMFTSVIVWSRQHGTGKSFIGRIMRAIYGPRNSTTITSAQLSSQFNAWAMGKQFIVGEEVSDYASKNDSHALKILITEPTLQARRMYVEPHEFPNRANFYFTSNEPSPIKIEDADRRFFVTTLEDKRDEVFWKRLDKWAWQQDGAAQLLYHLLNEVDLRGFDPKHAAPTTEEKRRVIYAGMTEVEQWCHDLMEGPESVRGREAKIRQDQDVFSVEAVYSWFHSAHEGSNVPVNIFGRALRKAGALSPSQAILCLDGRRRRVVALRNLGRWRQAKDLREWATNYAMGSPETKIEKVEKAKVTNIEVKRRLIK